MILVYVGKGEHRQVRLAVHHWQRLDQSVNDRDLRIGVIVGLGHVVQVHLQDQLVGNDHRCAVAVAHRPEHRSQLRLIVHGIHTRTPCCGSFCDAPGGTVDFRRSGVPVIDRNSHPSTLNASDQDNAESSGRKPLDPVPRSRGLLGPLYPLVMTTLWFVIHRLA